MKLGHLLMMKMRMKVINFRELNSLYCQKSDFQCFRYPSEISQKPRHK